MDLKPRPEDLEAVAAAKKAAAAEKGAETKAQNKRERQIEQIDRLRSFKAKMSPAKRSERPDTATDWVPVMEPDEMTGLVLEAKLQESVTRNGNDPDYQPGNFTVNRLLVRFADPKNPAGASPEIPVVEMHTNEDSRTSWFTVTEAIGLTQGRMDLQSGGRNEIDPSFVDQALEIERVILDPLHAGLNA